MKKMYCMKCGQEVPVRFGMIPNRCTCGAEFHEWNKNTVKNTALCMITFLLLMSMKCGQEVPVRFGMIPNRCTCGAEFHEWNKNTVKNTALCMITFLLLMSPLFVIIYFTRKFLRDSIILYAIMLVAFIICFRQADSAVCHYIFYSKIFKRFYYLVCNYAGCFYHLLSSGGGDFSPDWNVENEKC